MFCINYSKVYSQINDTIKLNEVIVERKPTQLPYKLPDFIEVFYLKVKTNKGNSENCYLYALDSQFVYVLTKDFFSDPMPDSIHETDLEIYNIQNIRYLKFKKKMIYSKAFLMSNKWLDRVRIRDHFKAFLLTVGVSGGIGLLFDAAYFGFNLFPFFTAMYTAAGVTAAVVVIAANIIKNRFFKSKFFEWNHLYFSENLRFKYDFKDDGAKTSIGPVSKLILKKYKIAEP